MCYNLYNNLCLEVESHGFYEDSVRSRTAQAEDDARRRHRGLRRAASDGHHAVHRFRAVLISHRPENSPLPMRGSGVFLSSIGLSAQAVQGAFSLGPSSLQAYTHLLL